MWVECDNGMWVECDNGMWVEYENEMWVECDNGMWVACVTFPNLALKLLPCTLLHVLSSLLLMGRERTMVTWKSLVQYGRASVSMRPWMTAPTSQPEVYILSYSVSNNWTLNSLCCYILEFYLLEKPILVCVCVCVCVCIICVYVCIPPLFRILKVLIKIIHSLKKK